MKTTNCYRCGDSTGLDKTRVPHGICGDCANFEVTKLPRARKPLAIAAFVVRYGGRVIDMTFNDGATMRFVGIDAYLSGFDIFHSPGISERHYTLGVGKLSEIV